MRKRRIFYKTTNINNNSSGTTPKVCLLPAGMADKNNLALCGTAVVPSQVFSFSDGGVEAH